MITAVMGPWCLQARTHEYSSSHHSYKQHKLPCMLHRAPVRAPRHHTLSDCTYTHTHVTSLSLPCCAFAVQAVSHACSPPSCNRKQPAHGHQSNRSTWQCSFNERPSYPSVARLVQWAAGKWLVLLQQFSAECVHQRHPHYRRAGDQRAW